MKSITLEESIPAHWVCFLINGEDDGLSDREAIAAMRWEAQLRRAYKSDNIVIEPVGESYFGYWPHDWGCPRVTAGDLQDVIITIF